ncbi:MAG: hypothetical protein K9I71_13245 [Ignavibacteriales bacterium]|nr:hypothetical protein [Ignavibacteriales bacterium]MCF8438675.1 hypothetical protein [Ignavibacteriales bacterium]
MNFSKELGILHNKYGLFSRASFSVKYEKNIINFLEDFPYLKSFYEEYQKEFTSNQKEQIDSKEARSTDLPFLGIDVITKGEADFIFYFEGSLASTDKLSITVLAHLWLTNDKRIIDKFIGKNKWWTFSNYRNVKSKLNVQVSHTLKSYIADAKRFKDNDKCSDLIHDEINLLKPKLVISIGNTAKNLVGMNYYELPTKFHFVKFPKYHNDLKIYTNLNSIMNRI